MWASALSLTWQLRPAYGCGVGALPRISGILLHCTSLPGRFGIGDFRAMRLTNSLTSLHAAGQKLWQVLPLNPTGYGDSPYQCFSAFAGNPLLLSLERLRDQGLLRESDLAQARRPFRGSDRLGQTFQFKKTSVCAGQQRLSLLMRLAQDRAAFDHFCEGRPVSWLDDFALFMALKDGTQRKQPGPLGGEEIRRRDPRSRRGSGRLGLRASSGCHQVLAIRVLPPMGLTSRTYCQSARTSA